MVHRVGSVTA